MAKFMLALAFIAVFLMAAQAYKEARE